MGKENLIDLERLVAVLCDSSVSGVHLASCVREALKRQDLEVVDGHVREIEPDDVGYKIDAMTGEVLRVPPVPGKSLFDDVIARVPEGMLVNELMRRGGIRKFECTKSYPHEKLESLVDCGFNIVDEVKQDLFAGIGPFVQISHERVRHGDEDCEDITARLYVLK